MKGRPKNVRKISFMPAVSGFRPYGDNVDKSKKACVFLFYEEYEAVRLNDYEKHSQCESAQIMQVSRPTFTRIYMSAREKIAKAFVEGLRIVVEGGKVELDGDWYVCKKCKAVFSTENGEAKICALCGSQDVEAYTLPEPVETSVLPKSVKSVCNTLDDSSAAGGLKPLRCRRGGCGRRRCQGQDAIELENKVEE